MSVRGFLFMDYPHRSQDSDEMRIYRLNRVILLRRLLRVIFSDSSDESSPLAVAPSNPTLAGSSVDEVPLDRSLSANITVNKHQF